MDGVIGSARGRTDAVGQNGTMMTADACDALNVAPSFTVSGWLYPTAMSTWSYVFARKNADSYKSWGWQFRSSSALTPVGIYSCGTSDVDEQRNIFSVSAFAVNTWTKYDVVWNDTSVSLYLNGSLIGTQTIKPSGTALDGSLAFTVGGLSGSGYGTLKAYHDEVRIATTPLSADWVAADYAQVANSDYYVYGDVMPVDDSAIVFADEPIVTEHDGQLILSVSLAEDSGSGSLSAIYGDALPFAATNQFENAAIAGQTYSTALTELTDDTSYRYGVIGENDKGTITRKFSSQAFYNGTPQLTAGEDADEVNLKTPGTIVVSRSDSIGDLTVNYTVGGTAVADVNYVALSGTVVIPDGQTSANIEVYPLRVKDGDHTLSVTLAAGAYLLGSTAPSAEIAVKELQTPEGWNTWVAAEAGNASDADNWSDGVPKSGDKVLFASCFSNTDCRWDVVHADGKAVLSAWTQSGDDNAYTGTIVFETAYPSASGALKTVEITGDVDLQSGTWTHPANGANEEYRLSVAVGGAFTLGADATLSAAQKGYGTGKWPSGSAAGSHAASGSGRQYVYGNVYRPSNCGAGSSDGAGGGAIWLEVGGAAQLDGLVDVRGYSADNKSQAASGSFYLKAASCAGAGKIYANVAIASCYSGSYGSGGRVGIELTGAETLDFPVANISIAGTNSGGSGGGGGTLWVGTADSTKPNGTLYLNDSRNKNYGARWQKRTAVAAIPAG
ncbi:MAG: LamG-like jellyroll fold domain-containing protein, partial [Kiritimatiellia bacterium]